MKWFGPTQFALYRIIFGLYLTIHFFDLLSVGTEIFSQEGVIPDSKVLPAYGKLPLLIFNFDTPFQITLLIYSLIATSIFFMLGFYRRLCAFYIFYGWISLLNRNPLISNPSLGYIGWILLACTLIPTGERLGFLLSEEQRKKESEELKKQNAGRWEVPEVIFYGMWIIMGVSYTASGVHKLQCPSWINGTALYYVLTGPLVRDHPFINPFIKFLVSNMFLVKFMAWMSLFLEISTLFIGTFYRTRKYYWLAFMQFHLGILMTVNFGDLTVGMLLAHLFTFDASWFQFTRELVEKYDWNGKKSLDFDINHSDSFNTKPLQDVLKEDVANSTKLPLSPTTTTTTNKKFSDERNLSNWLIWAIGLTFILLAINFRQDLRTSIDRLTSITLDMYWGFGIIILIAGIIIVFEGFFPDQKLPHVEGWWKWVVIINFFQIFAVVLATFTWENWLQNTSYFTNTAGWHLRDHVTPFWGGFIAYIINQWLFYHWHKARHEVYFFWITCHQFHHSPSRIETITSFYKHPLEIILDSQIMAILLYSVLGLSSDSSIWLSTFSAVGEYIYHMNIKTPKIMGYFFQRPESHRCHHRRNKRLHCPNYSDFPLWDILGGTFENPETMDKPTGFSYKAELKRLDMLFFKDVLFDGHQNLSSYLSNTKKTKQLIRRYLTYFLVIWGSLNASAFLAHNEDMREIGFVTVSSPLPLVFSAYNGVETFATRFDLNLKYKNGTTVVTDLEADRYNLLGGAYNRRNVYGAIFSHGPFFDKEPLINLRQNILKYAICEPGLLMNEFNLPGKIERIDVNVLYRPEGDKKIGSLSITC